MTRAGRFLVGATALLAGACEGGGESAASGRSAASSPAPDSAAAERPTYVSYAVLAGPDTLGVERVLRSPGRLAGEVTPADSARSTLIYEATLGSDGMVRSVTVEPRAAGTGSRAGRRVTFHFGDGIVVRESAPADSVLSDTLRVGTGALPWISASAGFLEQLLRRARAAGADTVDVPLVDVSAEGDATVEARVTWQGEGFASVHIGDAEPLRATLDAEGRLARAEDPGGGVTIARRR